MAVFGWYFCQRTDSYQDRRHSLPWHPYECGGGLHSSKWLAWPITQIAMRVRMQVPLGTWI
eukprot:202381-Amphidinium_carterae.1